MTAMINLDKVPDFAIALQQSCQPHEGVILLNGQWLKMPRTMIQEILNDAVSRAGFAAIRQLGIEPMLRGEVPLTATLADASVNLDIEGEHAAVTLTLSDGRKAQGFASLKRLGPRQPARGDDGKIWGQHAGHRPPT